MNATHTALTLLALPMMDALATTAPAQEPAPDLAGLVDWLDRDRDGRVAPYEGAEAMLFMTEVADGDGDGSLTAEEIAAFLEEQRREDREELEEIVAELDLDGDRALNPLEVPPELLLVLAEADTDGDSLFSFDELAAFDLDDPALFLRAEVLGLLAELDHDGDGIIVLSVLPEDDAAELAEFDLDGDGRLVREELLRRAALEAAGATFRVEGERAFLSGTLGPSTPGRVLELVMEHPEVEAIWMEDVPGSIDDESNLRAARLVRKHGLVTVAPAHAEIASGGVDFFLAGEQRVIEAGARLGVHSWGGIGESGADVPREDPAHEMYLEFYAELEIPAEFYWFTLRAAPAEDIHWMTPDEVLEYGVAEVDSAEGMFRTPEGAYGLDELDLVGGFRGIVGLPDSVDGRLRAEFDRYTRVVAPGGGFIHILASPGWSDDGIVRARRVLEHLLTDVPESRFGLDKRAVADAMAERRATLVLFDDQESMERAFDEGLDQLDLRMQDLRANECPVEGSLDYLAHATRDAAFEEILHLVHDYGIRPALPVFDAEIQQAHLDAASRGIWSAWPEDEPDSHRNEYIAVLYDNYLDLWTVPPTVYEGEVIPAEDLPFGTSHFGTYQAGSRAKLAELDAPGLALVEAFFPDALTYTAELPLDFRGTFTMRYQPSVPYTTKSRHLRHATLRGGNPAALVGNDHVNHLTGNPADNRLEGRGGDDVLDGGDGSDVAFYQGLASEYGVGRAPEGLVVIDRVADRDGTDVLRWIEFLSFADRTVDTRSLR